MKSSIENLTLASILTSLFVVITMFALSTGLAYGIYLDFLVPIYFSLVYLKCGGRYSFLSGIVSALLVFAVLGNIAGSIFVIQGFLMGIICSYFLCRDSILIEDLFFSSIISSFLILIVDLFTKSLTGYSILVDFQEMINWFPYKNYLSLVFYLLISFYTAGMAFSIYILTLIAGKRLNILSGNSLKKWTIFKKLKFFNRFLCMKRNTFTLAIIYIIFIEILNILNIEINTMYLKVVMIAIQYISYYYVIRDTLIIIKDFIISRYKKAIFLRAFTLISLVLFCICFKIQTLLLSVISFIIDIKNNIRPNQKKIVDLYYDKITL